MMRIREFAIDRFGMLHSQHVPFLADGITVFLGENEAGKSTCLNFFRAMLFGYARNRKSMDYLADAKAASGGSLVLESDDLGLVRLSRKPGPHGGPFSLTGPDGAPRPDTDLSLLLRGCTPDLYDRVFAFSLGELMHFGSLTDDRVRHALHGAAFGTGLRSPGQVLKELDEDMRRIFAPRATSSRVQTLLRELDEVNATIRERGNEVDRYAALRVELEAAVQELEGSKAAREIMEKERRTLERKMALRRRWEAFRETEDALAAFPEIAGVFTPDGRERLDRLVERLEDRRHAAAAARRALERAEEEAANLHYDPALAAASEDAQALAERKESVREAVNQLQVLASERDGLERDAAAVCADLGPEWDAARLESCDLSLAVHETCAGLGQRLLASDQAALLAQNEAGRIERERRAAETACEETRAALREYGGDSEESPAPEADEAAMERLAQLLVRAADAHEKTGALAQAARSAEQALDQAVAAIDPAWSRQDFERAAVSPADRERLLALARTVSGARSLVAEREREHKAVALLHEDAANRVAVLERSAASLLAGVPEAASLPEVAARLDSRRRVLRRAQAARKNLENALAAYGSANEQLGDVASLVRGARRGNTFPWSTLILFLAALCLVCGGGVLYLGLSGNLANMTLGGSAGLAAGAALGVSWLVLAARGKTDDAGEAMERNWAAIEQRLVRTRIASQNARLEAEDILETLARETPDLFPDGVVDGDALAEAEQLLSRAREQLAVLERETKDLDRERATLNGLCRRLDQAAVELETAQRACDDAAAAWEGALAALRLPVATAPEDARSLLERLDAALLRRSNAQGRLAEQTAARETLGECLHFAKSLPGLADRLASLPEPDSHFAPDHGPWLEAAREYLAEWRSAGRERIRLRELLAVREARFAELAALHDEALAALNTAKKAAGEARDAWEAWLSDRGFASSLSPETARRALEAAAKARSSFEAARRTGVRLEALRRDIVSFARDLANLAVLMPDHPGSGQPALLASACETGEGNALSMLAGALALLDDLVTGARRAGENAAIARDRERELPALRDDAALAVEQVAATQTELDTLLGLAGCEDPESYRSAHAVWARREAALIEQRTALASLEREASDAGLAIADLAASFAVSGPEEAAAELRERDEELGEALARERDLAGKKGGLETAMRGLMNEKGLTALLARREGMTAEIEDLAREWSRLAVARELLLTAKGRFEAERQTGVVRDAGELFRSITEGAYSGITVSLEDESVGAVARDGTVKNPETELSRGTREQLYLALRLAYVIDHGAQAEKLPVIMDDILVNFDARRARSTASVLASFAAQHQVLFFTCHESTAALLEEVSPKTARYTLDRGVFIKGERKPGSRKTRARGEQI
ncbi:AAA family ATPase [Desulfovibrio sp. OttesenSCG-928-O18]|nr:AAA family ATPase [Desulfovibrio sp. OttesenSCG-928-O18]